VTSPELSDESFCLTDVSPYLSRKKIPWPESAGELYRTSDRRLSVKLVPTVDRGCHVVSVTDP
jgi:hypothetical protein